MSFIMTPSGREGMKKYGWRDWNKTMTIGTEMVDGEVCVSYFRPPVDHLIQQLAEPAPGAEVHVYQQLPSGCVRLLRRVPSPGKTQHNKLNKVLFDFVIGSLDDASKPPHKYSAISYCWGDLPAESHLVFGDGSYLPITKKAARILARIAVDADHIWLDAVCINQANLAEKELQIPLMANIYRSASSVEVWLGRDEGIPRVFSPAAQNPTTSPNAKFQIEYDPDRHDPFTPYSHQNVVDLIWSPWFERAWVVQELCFARELRYHFGHVILHPLFFDMILKDLKSTRFVDHEKGQLQIPLPPMIRNFQNMRRLRHFLSSGSSSNKALLGRTARLEDILCDFYGLKSTDPRDKVFAMLNFVEPETRQDIKPDYTRHPADVYHDAMESVLFRGTSFRIFGFAGLAASRPIFDDRPNTASWIPDLSTAPEHTVWSAERSPGCFQATAALPPNQAVSLRCFHAFDSRTIAAGLQDKSADGSSIAKLTQSYEHHQAFIVPHGKHIATVTDVLPGDPSQNMAHLPHFLSSAIQKTGSHCKAHTDKAKDFFGKTLIAENPDFQTSDPDGKGFEELCGLLLTTKPHEKTPSKGKGKVKTPETNSEPDKIPEPRSPLSTLFTKDSDHLEARSYVEAMLQEGTGSTRGLFWTVPAPETTDPADNKTQGKSICHLGIGLAANGVQPDDQVWLMVGARVPFILHPLAAPGPYSEPSLGLNPDERVRRAQQASEDCSVDGKAVKCETGMHDGTRVEKRASDEERAEKKDKSASPPCFHLVCEAYVCGIMHAEVDIVETSKTFLLF
ncbi:heterokaryon incompatibility protein-domain-containing protein [Rhypophila decipiens]|uniref:Heterokaryon incompatibility protein-domain-containing protein n=1 Tax=Rhypophila decipiens TaxID=261697 RepID=A0AAN7B3T6_9PEZI|nr:heterokaryon incompatibility protein-domain-containing protein [Rhypophila decipiens]